MFSNGRDTNTMKMKEKGCRKKMSHANKLKQRSGAGIVLLTVASC